MKKFIFLWIHEISKILWKIPSREGSVQQFHRDLETKRNCLFINVLVTKDAWEAIAISELGIERDRGIEEEVNAEEFFAKAREGDGEGFLVFSEILVTETLVVFYTLCRTRTLLLLLSRVAPLGVSSTVPSFQAIMKGFVVPAFANGKQAFKCGFFFKWTFFMFFSSFFHIQSLFMTIIEYEKLRIKNYSNLLFYMDLICGACRTCVVMTITTPLK